MLVRVEQKPLTNVAVVYAGPSFHEEVTASMACMLQSLGYNVVVYIENGISIGGWVLPFSQHRKQSSEALYGRCVSRWVTINSAMDIEPNPEVLMYITYPMNHKDLSIEENSYRILRKLHAKAHDRTHLILVNHRTTRFWSLSAAIDQYIPLKNTTFLFLAEHTFMSAKRQLAQRFNAESERHKRDKYKLAYVYPVFSLDRMFGYEERYIRREARPQRKEEQTVSFAVQGNFGGAHAKRRDLDGTISCLAELSKPSSAVAQNTTHLRAAASAAVRLDLIGHVNGKLHLPSKQALHRLQLHRQEDLSAQKIYGAIARTQYLVTSLGSDAYSDTQATSSVPAALIARVPVVTTKAFLQLYPCLRDAPVHQHLNNGTECEALQRAYTLSAAEYSAAKQEVRVCADQLWDDALTTLRSILQRGT
jgi:hypothetical protein